MDRACRGRKIVGVRVLDERILEGLARPSFSAALKGRSIDATYRHGKQLFVDLGGIMLTIHLGMTGDVAPLGPREHVPRHTRALLKLDGGLRLAYDDPRMFGALGVAASVEGFVKDRGLGPDALLVSADEFVSRSARSSRAVKALLLDQRVLAGVGNLYADEALFQARIHPSSPSRGLSGRRLEALGMAIPRVLQSSIAAGTYLSNLPEGYLLRDRGPGAPCPRGDGHLAMIRVGGRASFFCPACQKA